jgi:hypothetical protein
MFSFVPAMAAGEQPDTFKSTITVTEEGGRYQIGFVNLEFKKEFLQKDKLPAVFDVEIAIKDGYAGIEIKEDTDGFFKKVHIRVDSYEGLLYNKDTGEFVNVKIKKQQILAGHFSRYAFA